MKVFINVALAATVFAACSGSSPTTPQPTPTPTPVVFGPVPLVVSEGGVKATLTGLSPSTGTAVKLNDPSSTFSFSLDVFRPANLSGQGNATVTVCLSVDGKECNQRVGGGALTLDNGWKQTIDAGGSSTTFNVVPRFLLVIIEAPGQRCEPQGSPNCVGIPNVPATRGVATYQLNYS